METKLVKVESMLNYFILTYSDESVKYLQTHSTREIVEAFKKGGKKRRIFASPGFDSYIGNTITINDDGSFTLNEKDNYSLEDIASNAKDNVNEVFSNNLKSVKQE